MSRFPIFRIAAGIVFVLAGIFAYYGVSFEAPLALVLVIAGAAILVAVLLGHRSHSGDVAIFVIALLVFAAVGYGLNFESGTGQEVAEYSLSSSKIIPNQIYFSATSNAGSISVQFVSNASLGYQVIFRRGFGISFFPPFTSGNYSLTNQTRNGVLFLNASANYMSIQVTLGVGYLTSVFAHTGAGSIVLSSTENVSLGTVSLDSGAGSISMNLPVRNISSLDLSAGAGSVDFSSNYLRPSGTRVPLTISAGTGSVSFKASFPSSIAVLLNASTGIGGITENLPGFAITHPSSESLAAYAGAINTATDSFSISLSTGTGSVNVNARLV